MKRFIPLLFVLAALPAAADIYHCIGPEGAVLYTDEGCPAGWREVARLPDVAGPEARELRRPQEPLEDRLARLWSGGGVRNLLWPYGIPALYGLLSVICFAVYARDKRRARQGQWRTSEGTLHLLELAGGWPGGLLAQITLRHKNRKPAYQAVFWSIVGLHVLVWAEVWYGGPLSRSVLPWVKSLF